MQFSHFNLRFFFQTPVYVNMLNKTWKNEFNWTVNNIFHAALYTASERPSMFILIINQLDAQNLFYNKFISCLYMFRPPDDEHMVLDTRRDKK